MMIFADRSDVSTREWAANLSALTRMRSSTTSSAASPSPSMTNTRASVAGPPPAYSAATSYSASPSPSMTNTRASVAGPPPAYSAVSKFPIVNSSSSSNSSAEMSSLLGLPSSAPSPRRGLMASDPPSLQGIFFFTHRSKTPFFTFSSDSV